MYEQNLIKTVTPIKANIIKRTNRYKKWEYGYNKEHDVVVISKDGTIGEIIEVQGLCIALPSAPKDLSKATDRWEAAEYPKELNQIKTVFDWESRPEQFKNKWYAYIDEEFIRREQGFWFNNKGTPTYITGSH